MDNIKIKTAIEFATDKIKGNLNEFAIKFPAEQSTNYVYKEISDPSWTEGFWTGMLWLSYELTKNEEYKKIASEQLTIYKKRIDSRINTDMHDLGFLYTLSAVAEYKIIGNEIAKDIALKAADLLIERFREKGEFIQAWGEINNAKRYLFIIDCLMNIPLLYWATEESKNEKYKKIAKRHLKTAMKYLVRDDFSTNHSCYFDTDTGEALRVETIQGYSDNSIWSRGQSWSVYGIALSYAYTKDESLIPIFIGVTKKFIENLGNDYVSYWDMVFTEGDEPKDTSATAIAICGIFEMSKYIDISEYVEVAHKMLESLIDNYTTKNIESNGILTNAMYSKPHGDKPECNIWGDYFYLEALMRLSYLNWKMYW